MLAERDESPAAVPVRVDITSAAANAPTSKKRKTAPSGGASPAPEAVLPVLSISKGPFAPTFLPVREGSAYHSIEGIVNNHNGFRYAPAGAAPPGSALLARSVESLPAHYRVSWEDRSPAIKATTDGRGLVGADGFRSARGNAPVREGAFYVEFTIEHAGGARATENAKSQGAHVRIGWARREAPLTGPVGMDGYSYAVRDVTGEKVTLSRPRPYGHAFGPGDVVGMYISLPPKRAPDPRDEHDPAHVHRERIPIQLKDKTYFESKEYPVSKEMAALMDGGAKETAPVPAQASKTKKSAGGAKKGAPGPSAKVVRNVPRMRPLPVLEGSYIAFFINGECQGVAFRDLYDYRPLRADPATDGGKNKQKKRSANDVGGPQAHRDNPFDDGSLGYYPMVSLFNEARVRMNPGPDFAFPPPDDVDALLAPNARAPGGEMDVDVKPEQARNWRPICERYDEYFREQCELDDQDEARAREAAVLRAKEVEQQEKLQVARDRKRQQAQARKKSKLALEGQAGEREESVVTFEDEVLGLSRSGAATPAPEDYAPSPLRYDLSAAYPEHTYSPAATPSSGIDVQAGNSGYNSENLEERGESMAPEVPSRQWTEEPQDLPEVRYG